jgi:hypothetical protein
MNALAVNETSAISAVRPGLKQPLPVQPETVTEKNIRTEADQQQIAAVEKNETRIRTEDLLSRQTTESVTAPAPFVQPAVAMNVKSDYASDALTGEIDDEETEPLQDESRQRKGLRGIVRKANRIYNKVTNPDLDKPLVKVANLEIGLQR